MFHFRAQYTYLLYLFATSYMLGMSSVTDFHRCPNIWTKDLMSFIVSFKIVICYTINIILQFKLLNYEEQHAHFSQQHAHFSHTSVHFAMLNEFIFCKLINWYTCITLFTTFLLKGQVHFLIRSNVSAPTMGVLEHSYVFKDTLYKFEYQNNTCISNITQ